MPSSGEGTSEVPGEGEPKSPLITEKEPVARKKEEPVMEKAKRTVMKEPSIAERIVERIINVNRYPLEDWIVVALIVITVGALIATGIKAFR